MTQTHTHQSSCILAPDRPTAAILFATYNTSFFHETAINSKTLTGEFFQVPAQFELLINAVHRSTSRALPNYLHHILGEDDKAFVQKEDNCSADPRDIPWPLPTLRPHSRPYTRFQRLDKPPIFDSPNYQSGKQASSDVPYT